VCKRGVNTKSGVTDNCLWTMFHGACWVNTDSRATCNQTVLSCAAPVSQAEAAAMDMPLTFALTVGFGGLAVFCGWRGAQPPNVIKGPRIMPWRMLMLLSAAACILMLVHLVNLAGVPTGNHQGQF